MRIVSESDHEIVVARSREDLRRVVGWVLLGASAVLFSLLIFPVVVSPSPSALFLAVLGAPVYLGFSWFGRKIVGTRVKLVHDEASGGLVVRQRFRRPRYVSDEELDSLFITAGSEAAHHRSRVRIKYRTELSTELNLLFAGTSLSHLRTAEKIVEWITGERARVRKPSETGTVGSPTGGASVVSDFGLAAEGGCGGDLGCSSMVLVLSVGLLVWLLVGF